MRRTSLRAAALTALLLTGPTACGYGSQKDTGKAAVVAHGTKLSAATVRIGYFPNLTHATALVGDQQGIIQRELGGTVLKSSTFNAGPAEIEALNAGSIDIGWIGPSPAINGYTKSKGESLRIVSGSASGGVKLVVDPKRIHSLDEVKGKRIATPQKGNTQDVAFLNWLAQRGWRTDPQSGKGEVSVLRIDNKITPDAFKSHSVDGAWVPEPTAAKLVAEGGKVLLDESALWPDGKFVITNVVVSRKFLAAHPDVVEAVLRGSVKTNAWIRANPGPAENAANTALERLTGKALPPEVLDPAWRSIQVTDDPLAATLDTEAAHAVAAGLLDKPDLSGIYDLTLLNKVLKSQGRTPVSAAKLGRQ
ncbi:aliphatic sulfonate ABC transporter substrate-binding protein [Streptomyces orinoci]|uniref:Aliphatic sulfonate ABC transporter substrate-binding protein n=1 Tax=Streptomyces orinoci TaxID=67339 RepID=A0ABV3K046_STRON|nr:aliphatic sulfonate ABC transporter substrate-binding protein [Streptomyces orinoci]